MSDLVRRRFLKLFGALVGVGRPSVVAPLEALAICSGFIMLTDDGEHMTNEMPVDESVVEVVLTDGSIRRAHYSENLMEVGDWEFSTVGSDGEAGDESLSHVVAGWRRLVL